VVAVRSVKPRSNAVQRGEDKPPVLAISGRPSKRAMRLLSGARILVVDDDSLTRRMLERLLRGARCDVVCASGKSAASEILASGEESFDAAVVDMLLGDGRGAAVITELRTLEMPCSSLMITGYDDERAAQAAIAAGADDFLRKPFSREEFLNAVAATVEKTATWRDRVSPQRGNRRSKKDAPEATAPLPPLDRPTLGMLDLDKCADELALRGGLTSRERDIVKLLLLGRTNKDIADATGATERTAKFHVSNILVKLKMKSRAELLRVFF
jgi:DNA-binding NarL/FixJ family response regulator